jgi:adenylylsulfate kinase-like enzyme
VQELLRDKFIRLSQTDIARLTELAEDLAIDKDNCIPSLLDQAAKYSKWSEFANYAQTEHAEQKHYLETVVTSQARARARDVLKAADIKVTEGSLNDVTYVDTVYQAEAKKLLTLDDTRRKFKDALEAVVQRGNNLPNIAAYQRHRLNEFSNSSLDSLKDRARSMASG